MIGPRDGRRARGSLDVPAHGLEDDGRDSDDDASPRGRTRTDRRPGDRVPRGTPAGLIGHTTRPKGSDT